MVLFVAVGIVCNLAGTRSTSRFTPALHERPGYPVHRFLRHERPLVVALVKQSLWMRCINGGMKFDPRYLCAEASFSRCSTGPDLQHKHGTAPMRPSPWFFTTMQSTAPVLRKLRGLQRPVEADALDAVPKLRLDEGRAVRGKSSSLE